MKQKIHIIDYGMGNLHSVIGAIEHLGASLEITNDPKTIEMADTLILPGVGSFYKAMEKLEVSGLSEAIAEAVTIRNRKILGICLGQQLMSEYSEEDGGKKGLKLIPGSVSRFNSSLGVKVPHIGFNQVVSDSNSKLFKSLNQTSDFYFVHSYRLSSMPRPGKSAICNYSGDFVAAYEHENIFATQFHPEKSQMNGLLVLSNFLKA